MIFVLTFLNYKIFLNHNGENLVAFLTYVFVQLESICPFALMTAAKRFLNY